MALKNFQYEAIMRDYNQKQFLHKHEQDEHIRTAEEKIPRLAEIRREIANLGLKKARLILGADQGEDFDLAATIKSLGDERRTLLEKEGFPPDYLELHYDCPVCKDTGFVNGEKCACFRKAAVDLLYTQSNIRDILDKENFASFTFQYYSSDFQDPGSGITALEAAHQAYDKAWDFINCFQKDFNNLMIYGDTGVGKTFLTHCIAKELLDRSFFLLIYLICCPKTLFRKIGSPLIWLHLFTTVICLSLMTLEQNLPTVLYLLSFSAASMSGS